MPLPRQSATPAEIHPDLIAGVEDVTAALRTANGEAERRKVHTAPRDEQARPLRVRKRSAAVPCASHRADVRRYPGSAIWYRHEHVATVPLTGITTPKGYTPRYETFVCPGDVRRATADAMCGHLAGIGGKVQVRTVSEGRHKP